MIRRRDDHDDGRAREHRIDDMPQDVPAWYAQRWMDGDGNAWQEVDLAKLAVDSAFLQVGI